MLHAIERPQPFVRLAVPARPFEALGGVILRYGLVFFLVGIGLLKFTQFEAEAIQPYIANSPFMHWLYGVASVQGASAAIGIVEITLGLLLALRRWLPALSAVGSFGAMFTFLLTFSFLFTTPALSPDGQGFLMKDLMLFGAATWTAGDALRAANAASAR